MRNRNFFSYLLSAAGLVVMAATSGITFAADDQIMEEVVVTGSRIKRTDIIANSPVSIVSAAELEFNNTENVERLIRQLPQTQPGSTEGVNNGKEGAATVDLRGLGDERTLILIDGKRFVPFDSQGQVDVNNIPAPLIERVDVVTGGASAVYGSDAMAGVVNFILKQDFEGFEVSTSYRTTAEDDGEIIDHSMLVGGNFDNGKGNAVVHIGYTKREAVVQGDRSFSEFSLASDDGTKGGSSTDTNANIVGAVEWIIPGFETAGPQDFAGFDTNGNPQLRGTRRFNFNPFNLLQVPETRHQATTYINYQFTDSINAFGRIHFANTKISTEIAPSGTFFLGFDLPLNNVFLTPLTLQMLSDPNGDGVIEPEFDTDSNGIIDPDAVTSILIGRRTIEVGPRISNYETLAYQFVSGLQGNLSNGWEWEVSGQFGKTELTAVFENDLSSDSVQDALYAIDDGFGNIICDPAFNPAPGCAPANLFGDGNLSSEAAAFMALQLNEEKNSEQQIWTATLSGDFGNTTLPWTSQPIGFSVGYEYREEISESFPDQCYQTADCSIGFGSTVAVVNKYDVNELFAEILLPVTDDVNVELGYRTADYSTVGTVDAWKAGADWEIVNGLRLRAMAQSATRAPNIFEFGAPQRPNVGDADTDPCSGSADALAAGFDVIGDAVLNALCVATGTPGTGSPEIISGQLNITDGGNLNVNEESSDTVTFGFVWQPEFVAGLTVIVDYYDIEIEDAIDSFNENDVLNGCYNAALNPAMSASNSFCQLIRRDPLSGALFGSSQNGLLIVAQNIATRETSGIDFQVNYERDLPIGSLELSLAGTLVDEFDEQAASISPVNSCGGKYGNTCGAPNPELRFIQRTTWNLGDFTLSYRWRFIDEVEADNPANFFAPYQKIDATNYVDLFAGWTPANLQGLRVTVGIDNVTDEDAPVVGNDAGPTDQNSGNTWPGVYDTIGRAYFTNVNYAF